MPSRMVDVLIHGAGPAAAATAIGLRRHGVGVAIVRRPRDPARKTVETLPPDARPVLLELGALEHLEARGLAPYYGDLSRWGEPAVRERAFLSHPYGHGWRVDRPAFDQRLIEIACRAGARLTADEAGWSASFQVDATGRSTALVRRRGARRRYADRLTAFAARLTPSGDRDPRPLVESTEDGWWHSLPTPAGGLQAVFYTDLDLPCAQRAATPAGWEELLSKTSAIQQRGRPTGSAPTVVSARSSYLHPFAGTDWLAVGDAALTVDPLSSHGLILAMAGGLRAAEAIASGRLDDYNHSMLAAWHGFQSILRAHYRVESRWPEAPFWKRRLANSQREGIGGASALRFRPDPVSASDRG